MRSTGLLWRRVRRKRRFLLLAGLPLLAVAVLLSLLPTRQAVGEPVPQLSTVVLSPANSAVREIQGAAGETVAHPIKILPLGGDLYLIDGGRLLRSPLAAANSAEPLQAVSLVPADRRVSGVYMHELVDMVARSTQEIVLLDKLGNVFAFLPQQPLASAWQLLQKADLDANEPFPLLAALDAYDGVLYLLDSSRGQIQRQPSSPDRPALFFRVNVGEITEAVDLTVDGRVYAIMRNGTVKAYVSGLAADLPLLPLPPASSAVKATAPRQLFTQAGLPHMYVVDPPARRVLALQKDGWSYHQEYVYADPLRWSGLRDAAVSEGKLWVLVGTTLFTTALR